jgi:hypothetical protein
MSKLLRVINRSIKEALKIKEAVQFIENAKQSQLASGIKFDEHAWEWYLHKKLTTKGD